MVCLQFVECRIELFIFNLIVKWTSDHFDSGFERFSHQSLAFVYYSENSRSRLFKVIIKLLCAHCFSSLGTLYFFFLRVKKSFLSVSRCILGSGSSIFETPFLMNSSAYKVAPFFLLTIFLIHLRFLVQWFNGSMVPWFHGSMVICDCSAVQSAVRLATAPVFLLGATRHFLLLSYKICAEIVVYRMLAVFLNGLNGKNSSRRIVRNISSVYFFLFRLQD